MSPVFRHGRLRLYLLRLLDEEPRHGYEVIRMLRDQFMGVYAPSPGTIYPRLARLEEEGLVTHDEVDGRKVYRITDAGRQELHDRQDELTELEQELSDSVRDVVREVKEDVRETVRSLREELTWAARTARRPEGQDQAGQPEIAPPAQDDAGARRAQPRTPAEEARERARQVRDEARERARRARDDAKDHLRQARDQASWSGHEGDWGQWAGWTDWPGRRGWPGRPDIGIFRDLERTVRDFAGDLRRLAWQSGAAGEDALGELRVILEDTLERVRNEIFGAPGGSSQPGQPSPPGQPGQPGPDRAEPGRDGGQPEPGPEPPAGASPTGGAKPEPGSGPNGPTG
jgi:DNA-binding PadR family transcriptional regulator